MIDAASRRRLLGLARASVNAQVLGTAPPPVPHDLAIASAGVFVSLHGGKKLRGCLGSLAGEPLAHAVARLAAAVCHLDPRFPPVAAAELDAIILEISVLTRREPLVEMARIEIGRHGLTVEQGRRHGLLLPQVALEHDWDRETFLAHTCLKADLPRDAWRNGAVVCTFEAEVFGEE